MVPDYTPLAPTLVREPFHHGGWCYEEKLDIGACSLTRTACTSDPSAAASTTRGFPDLAKAVAKLSAGTLVIDGEVVVFDEQLQSRFEWLSHDVSALSAR
jgi:ATP-dependent DNA ligase